MHAYTDRKLINNLICCTPVSTDKILHIGLTDSASQRRKQKQRRTSQPADKTIKTLDIDMTGDGDSQKQSQDDSAQRGVNAVKKSGKKITRPEVRHLRYCI